MTNAPYWAGKNRSRALRIAPRTYSTVSVEPSNELPIFGAPLRTSFC